MNEKESKQNLHENHRERMRKRMDEETLDSFALHELFEMLFYYTHKRQDTNEIAHHLLNRFPTLGQLMGASIEELCTVDGIGEQSARLIRLIAQITKLYAEEKETLRNDSVLDNVEKIGRYAVTQFIGAGEEHLYLICMDNNYKLIHSTLISKGSLRSTDLNMRKIAETLMKYKASNIVLAHNHPEGPLQESNEDVMSTHTVQLFAGQLDVTLLDHIIVFGQEYISLREKGYFL